MYLVKLCAIRRMRKTPKAKEKETGSDRLGIIPTEQPPPLPQQQPQPIVTPATPPAPSPSRSPSSPESEAGPSSAGMTIGGDDHPPLSPYEPQPSTSKEATVRASYMWIAIENCSIQVYQISVELHNSMKHFIEYSCLNLIFQEKKWSTSGDGKPKTVTISHPGASKPKPITRKKHSLQADLDVEKEFQRCKDDGAKRLDLTKCSITNLPTSVKELSHLLEFYLYQNKLVKLPQEIGSLINLQILAVNENSLTSLPDSLANLKQLKVLDLRHNKLNEVHSIEFNSQGFRLFSLIYQSNRFLTLFTSSTLLQPCI